MFFYTRTQDKTEAGMNRRRTNARLYVLEVDFDTRYLLTKNHVFRYVDTSGEQRCWFREGDECVASTSFINKDEQNTLRQVSSQFENTYLQTLQDSMHARTIVRITFIS